MKIAVNYDNARSIERLLRTCSNRSFSMAQLIRFFGASSPIDACSLALNLDYLLVQRKVERVRSNVGFTYRRSAA